MKRRSYESGLRPLFKGATIPNENFSYAQGCLACPCTQRRFRDCFFRDVLHQCRLPRASFPVHPVNASASLSQLTKLLHGCSPQGSVSRSIHWKVRW